MTVDRDGPRLRQYWDLEPAPEEMSEEECIRRSIGLLRDAVRLQLRSDVPLGVFLSGGVDSSAVVALMHEMGIRDIQHLHGRLRLRAASSTRPARRGRWQSSSAPSTTRSSSRPEEFRDFIPSLVWHMDEPVTESAAVSLFFVSKLAREDVVVVLSGEGSDEVFGGYPIYKYMQTLERYRLLPASRAPGHDQPHAQPARRQVEQVHRALRSAARASATQGSRSTRRAPRTRSTGRRSEIFSTAAPCPAW